MNSILLINPPSSVYKNLPMPVGLLYLASYVNKFGFGAEILDLSVKRLSDEQIINFIKEKNPQMIGLSFFTVHFSFVKGLTELLKKYFPDKKIIAGGPHPTALPESTMESIKGLDVLIVGEGEITLRELLEDKRLEDIKGIVYRSKNRVVINPKRELIDNLDILPFPDFNLLPDLSSYQLSYTWEPNRPSAVIMTSRGCPYDCIYCASKVIWTRKVRFRSAENVLSEIEKLVSDFNIKEILFYDDTFLINKQRLEKICRGLIERRMNISWSCLGRIDAVDDNTLKLMKKAGCHMISFGVESANQEVLDAINKKVRKEQIFSAFESCQRIGIPNKASFIFGSPKETYQTIQETKDTLLKITPDYVFFFIMTPLPGTLLFSHHRDNNLLDGEWERFDQTTYRHFYGTDLTYQQLRQAISKAYRGYYFSFNFWKYLLSHLTRRKLRTLFYISLDLFAFFKYINKGKIK